MPFYVHIIEAISSQLQTHLYLVVNITCVSVLLLVLTSIRNMGNKGEVSSSDLCNCLSIFLFEAAGLHSGTSSHSHSVLNTSQTLTGDPAASKHPVLA